MGSFKSLTSQDVIISPLIVNKTFTFMGSTSLEDEYVFIERLIGKNLDGVFDENNDPTTGISSSYFQRNIYNSIKQLYYTNYIDNPISGSYLITDLNNNILESDLNTNVYSRFYNYLNTTLSGSRFFPTQSNAEIGIISIPSRLFGDYVNPNTFFYKTPEMEIQDDGEGYIKHNNNLVGTICYQHGIIVIASESLLNNFTSSNDVTCSFQSSRLIYETQYKCTIRENEFNYSLNPSLISGSNFVNPLVSICSLDVRGQVYDFVTGSTWAPYITTVGLYNENQELLAVAKLSQPLPTSRTTDMSIIINLDK